LSRCFDYSATRIRASLARKNLSDILVPAKVEKFIKEGTLPLNASEKLRVEITEQARKERKRKMKRKVRSESTKRNLLRCTNIDGYL
jgi:hypothetical protein